MVTVLALIPIIGILITVVVGAISVFLPQLTQSIIGAVNAPANIYSLLIEIPRPLWNTSIYLFQPIAPQLQISSGYSNLIGSSMTNFYAASRTAAFILLVFVVMLAAISFFLQTFKIMSEGTAARILMGSIMCIVLIWIFPPLYDAIAAAINALTFPSPSGILKPGMIEEILLHSASIIPTEGSDMGSAVAGLIMNLFLFIFTMVTYAGIAIMGVLRTFFIGAAFALMPILLVMRLLPFVDRIADMFMQVVVGGILASVIISLFFAFGYDLLMSPSITGLMKTLISLGLLMSSSLMLTFLIPSLGSMMSTISMTITGAATGAAVGGVAVTTGAVAAGYQAMATLSPMVASGEIGKASAILRGTGAILGGIAGALGATAPRMVPGAGGATFGIPAAVAMSRGAIALATMGLPNVDQCELADALILKAAATPHDQEDDYEKMREWSEKVKTDLLMRSPGVVGNEISLMTGMRFEDPEEVGRRVQDRIYKIMELTKEEPEAQRVILSRIGRLYSAWKDHTLTLDKVPDPEDKTKRISIVEAVEKELWAEFKDKVPDEKMLQKRREELLAKYREKTSLGIKPLRAISIYNERKENADKVAEYVQRWKNITSNATGEHGGA